MFSIVKKLYYRLLSSQRLQLHKVRRVRSSAARTARTASSLESNNIIYVDLTVLLKHDAHTGIQRVVRGLAANLGNLHLENWSIQPIKSSASGGFEACRCALFPSGLNDLPFDPQRGGIFLGLDYNIIGIPNSYKTLQTFRSYGGKILFLVHDLLPIRHPEWFTERTCFLYRRWLTSIAALGDVFLCNSKSTENQLRNELEHYYDITHTFRSFTIPLGCDLGGSSPSTGTKKQFLKYIADWNHLPVILMVGTIEPRKGHAEILDAFDILWNQTDAPILVIVGRPGWKTAQTQKRIRNHRFLKTKLFWLEDASDEELEQLYKRATGLIVGSFDEGFCLPVVESLAAGTPVLAREIECLKESPFSGHITFFPYEYPSVRLAAFIAVWINNSEATSKTTVARKPLPTWRESAQTVAELLKTCISHV